MSIEEASINQTLPEQNLERTDTEIFPNPPSVEPDAPEICEMFEGNFTLRSIFFSEKRITNFAERLSFFDQLSLFSLQLSNLYRQSRILRPQVVALSGADLWDFVCRLRMMVF